MINLPSIRCVMALEMLPIIGALGLVNPHEYYPRKYVANDNYKVSRVISDIRNMTSH